MGISDSLQNKTLNLSATSDKKQACKNANFVIVANRLAEDIKDVQGELYTRDLFGND
ncbi:MAG: hypothetical protein ACI9OH_003433 [Oleispira sp.]